MDFNSLGALRIKKKEAVYNEELPMSEAEKL